MPSDPHLTRAERDGLLKRRRPSEDLEFWPEHYHDNETQSTKSFFSKFRLLRTLNLIAQFLVDRITVKVTLWRLINTMFLLVFGTWKAVCAYTEDGTVKTLDMALGLFWAFVAYWACIQEAESPHTAPWLFETDVKEAIIHPLLALAIFLAMVFPLYTCGFFVLSNVLPEVANEVKVILDQVIALTCLVVGVVIMCLAAHLPFLTIFSRISNVAHRVIAYSDWNYSNMSLETPKYMRRTAMLLLLGMYCASCYLLTEVDLFSEIRKPPITIPIYVLSIGIFSIVLSALALYLLFGVIRMAVRLSNPPYRRGSLPGNVRFK